MIKTLIQNQKKRFIKLFIMLCIFEVIYTVYDMQQPVIDKIFTGAFTFIFGLLLILVICILSEFKHHLKNSRKQAIYDKKRFEKVKQARKRHDDGRL